MSDHQELTHFDPSGAARMVDVAAKPPTHRVAVAGGEVIMEPATLQRIITGQTAKGDVLQVARIAGIMAAKRCGELIPLCHPLALTAVTVDFSPEPESHKISITARAECIGNTGVEMEAMTAATVAGLTIYDMCKAMDRSMVITRIRLLRKSGGKSGEFIRAE